MITLANLKAKLLGTGARRRHQCHAQGAVLDTLLRFASNCDRLCPSLETLAAESGTSESTAQRAIAAFAALGWITIGKDRKPHHRWRFNVYELAGELARFIAERKGRGLALIRREAGRAAADARRQVWDAIRAHTASKRRLVVTQQRDLSSFPSKEEKEEPPAPKRTNYVPKFLQSWNARTRP